MSSTSSSSSSSSRIPLFQIIDDSIIKGINNGKYQISLLYLEQLLHEDGFLSQANQIRHAQCLYLCKRYTDAIEAAQRYSSQGNNSSDLQFITGLSLYQLGQYYEAANIFRFNPRFELWYRKSYIMYAFSHNALYKKKYDFPKKPITPTDWSQDKHSITIIFPYSCLLPSEVEIEFFPESVDIVVYRSEKECFTQTLELFSAISPEECSYKVTNLNITVKLIKNKDIEWPKLLDPNDYRNKEIKQEDEVARITPHTSKLFESSGIRAITKCKFAQIQMLGLPQTRIKRFLLKEEEEDEGP